jgi:hypothetical protein
MDNEQIESYILAYAQEDLAIPEHHRDRDSVSLMYLSLDALRDRDYDDAREYFTQLWARKYHIPHKATMSKEEIYREYGF